jgi:hypothetical protein
LSFIFCPDATEVVLLLVEDDAAASCAKADAPSDKASASDAQRYTDFPKRMDFIN